MSFSEAAKLTSLFTDDKKYPAFQEAKVFSENPVILEPHLSISVGS
jgi:hypothetical protein